jgi:ribosomal protein S18 acetylase RimI-like enzyme
MLNIIIRKAKKKDFYSLLNLRIKLLEYEHSLNNKNKFSESRIDKSKELIKTYLDRKNSVFFVAELVSDGILKTKKIKSLVSANVNIFKNFNTITNVNTINATITNVNTINATITNNDIENIVGYIHGTKDENPNDLQGYIQGLFVLESYRNKGIATLLLKELLKWFDCTKHGLTTDLNNELSLSFYKKHGYKVIDKNMKENESSKQDESFKKNESSEKNENSKLKESCKIKESFEENKNLKKNENSKKSDVVFMVSE